MLNLTGMRIVRQMTSFPLLPKDLKLTELFLKEENEAQH